jgi:hypothetical protein
MLSSAPWPDSPAARCHLFHQDVTMPHLRVSMFLVAIAALAATAGSTDAGTAPGGLAPSAAARSLGDVGSVFTVQLRSIPTDPILPPNPIFGYGNLQLRLGSVADNSCLPPNPITPQPGTTFLSVCGKIFNVGGALYRGGGIYSLYPLGEGPGLVAEFGGDFPNDACRRYDIAGAVTVPDAIASDMLLQPTMYEVRMNGDVQSAATRIGGRLDGSAWGSTNVFGDGYQPSDPYFAQKVCSVAIVP